MSVLHLLGKIVTRLACNAIKRVSWNTFKSVIQANSVNTIYNSIITFYINNYYDEAMMKLMKPNNRITSIVKLFKYLKKTNEVAFTSFLQSQNSLRLEAQIRAIVLCNLANQSLEWHLADKEFRRLLILPDFAEGDSARTIAMLLLDWNCRNVVTSECCKAGLYILPTYGFPVSRVLYRRVLDACHRKCGSGFESSAILFYDGLGVAFF